MLPAVNESTGEIIQAMPEKQTFGSLSVLEQAAIAEIQVGAMIALRNPRNEDQARDGILRACKRPGFAGMARYDIPNRGRGFTIRFSEEAVRLWGNIKFQRFIISNDAASIVCKVAGWDLQTGTSYSEDVMVLKIVERKKPQGREVVGQRTNTNGETVYLCVSTEEEMMKDLRSQCARVERNLGLKLIPIDVREDALTEVEKTNKTQTARDPEAAKRALLDSFSAINIRPIALQSFLGHSLDTVTEGELTRLRGIYAAIKSGETTWVEVARAEDEVLITDETPPPPPKRKATIISGKGTVRPAVTAAIAEDQMRKISDLCDKIAIDRNFIDPSNTTDVNRKSAAVYAGLLDLNGLTLQDPLTDEVRAELLSQLEDEVARIGVGV